MKSLNIIRVLIFFFLLFLYAAVYVVTTNDRDEQIKIALERQIENLHNNYKVSTNRFQILSDNFYNNVLSQEEVTELLYRANHAKTEMQRAAIREKLYTKMEPYFTQFRKVGLNILLFSFENNRTFLRVHKPEKFNDDLSAVRYSFRYVNDTKKGVRGFEQGKISHAFRNIFPLYHAQEYVGSVDFAFSSEVLQENMTDIHGLDTHFIVDKTIFDAKVWKRQNRVKYIKSIEHKDFLFSLTPSQSDNAFSPDKLRLNKSLKEEIYQNVKHHGEFALYKHNMDRVQIIAFLPIKNIKDNKTVAYLVSYADSYFLEKMLQKHMWTNMMFIFGLLILYVVIVNNIKQRYSLEAQVKEEVAKNRLQDKLLLEQSRVAQDKLNKSILLFGNNVISSSTDTKGIITYASQAFCDISGYSQEELIGKPHNILRHPDMSAEIYRDMWRSIKQGEVWDGEVKNRKKNGEYYWVRTSIMPDFNDEGNIVGYTAIRHDITAQKVKEEFMANMSHELRTPLNAILGFSAILKKKLEESTNKELIQQINSSANSLLILINDILDLAKIQDSKFSIEPFEFNAYEEMMELAHKYEGLTANNTLIFKTTISDNLKNIFYGDWVRLNQIILNLISNAVKFTPEDGEIDFSGDYKEGNFIVSVSDNGIGMNREVQDKIFKPFEQADGSTTRKYGGTGLGLSITQNLVEMMDGKIELESAEGVGTTFVVSIPLEKVDNALAKESEADLVEEDRENSLESHVLVVEDNKTNQLLIKMLLDEFGVTCDVANDGVEAVEMYNPDKHSLILMDENMPNMNGLEAMRIIKEKYEDRCGAIIALTANAMDGDRERFIKEGMDSYVSKPIDEEELYRVLKEFL